MANSTHDNLAPPQRWFPAWLISFVFHCAAIVLLVSAIERVPRGGSEMMDGTIDVVLNHTPAPAESYTPNNAVTEVAVAAVQYAQNEQAAPKVSEPPTETTDVASPATTNTNAANNTSATDVQAEAIEGGNYGPPAEGQVRVRVFGVEGVGTKFVYVFDRSTSMEGPLLATAKRQLIQSLESLEGLHQFHIIFFNQQLRHFNLAGSGRRIAFATDRNKQLAAKFVGGITADGGTDRLPALRAAIAMQPDVIFFLTDADDPMPESELADIERLNRRTGATICTIEFGRGPRAGSGNFLTQLAQLTGGQYGYVDTLQLKRQ